MLRSCWSPRLAVALDAIIAIYVTVLLAVVLTGGFDLGWISATRAAKPLFVLLLAVPIRLALSESGWLGPLLGRVTARSYASLQSAIRASPVVQDVAFAVAVTRVPLLVFGFFANLLFPANQPRSFEMPFRQETFFETLAAWDSGWYFDIASRGYYFNPEGQSSIAFFPLYPLTMRAVGWLFGGSDRAFWVAGILISWVAFILALVVLHRLAERLLGSREAARRTILYVSVFPFSFFFSSVYTESLFLLLSVAAVAFSLDGRWGRAGLMGGLAALTRPNGVVVLVPLALLALERWRESGLLLARRALALALVPAGLAVYCSYVYSLTGDPLGWLGAQQHWDYSLGHAPWRQLLQMFTNVERYGAYEYLFISPLVPFYLFHGATAVLFLVLTPYVFKQLGAPVGAYLLASLLIPLTSTDLIGIGRYCSVLFPAFMLMARIASPRVHEAILVVSVLFLALFTGLFVIQHPIY